MTSTTSATPTWAKVIDHTQCIGCHACTTACRSENEVPLSVTRTYVKSVDVGVFPEARRAFQVTRCNQCSDAPCTHVCPTSAMFSRPDGIVDFDKSVCIGCKACIAACPYDAIFINPEDHSAEKCNFCAHRLDMGLEPACVVVCPTEAIVVGDLNDPLAAVTRLINREATSVRRPEKQTLPKLFYVGAHSATLDPLAARRPDGGLFMWSEQGDLPHQVPVGHSGQSTSSAAALLSYDIPHRAPWDFRVSLYTWTKSIGAGVYLVSTLLAALGLLAWEDPVVRWVAPAIALFFLAATGGLLIWDLEHPARFLLIFKRPQWRSWLVRGGFILTAYSGILSLHLLAGLLGRTDLLPAVAVAGLVLAILTAVYTAFLFAQASGRDLWQDSLLPGHLVVQAGVAGGASLVVVGALTGGATEAVAPWFLGAMLAHLGLLAGEYFLPRPTAHGRYAHHEMVKGRYGALFKVSVALGLLALATPWIGVLGALSALAGLLAYEHAYVQAGQMAPLA